MDLDRTGHLRWWPGYSVSLRLNRRNAKTWDLFSFVNVIPENMHIHVTRAKTYDKQIMTSSAKVVIIYGEMNSTLEVSFRRWEYLFARRIWITTSQWDVITIKRDFNLDFFMGLSLLHTTKVRLLNLGIFCKQWKPTNTSKHFWVYTGVELF